MAQQTRYKLVKKGFKKEIYARINARRIILLVLGNCKRQTCVAET